MFTRRAPACVVAIRFARAASTGLGRVSGNTKYQIMSGEVRIKAIEHSTGSSLRSGRWARGLAAVSDVISPTSAR
jgi:hypothetical protein